LRFNLTRRRGVGRGAPLALVNHSDISSHHSAERRLQVSQYQELVRLPNSAFPTRSLLGKIYQRILAVPPISERIGAKDLLDGFFAHPWQPRTLHLVVDPKQTFD
jgi:hypothetical protein